MRRPRATSHSQRIALGPCMPAEQARNFLQIVGRRHATGIEEILVWRMRGAPRLLLPVRSSGAMQWNRPPRSYLPPAGGNTRSCETSSGPSDRDSDRGQRLRRFSTIHWALGAAMRYREFVKGARRRAGSLGRPTETKRPLCPFFERIVTTLSACSSC